MMSMRALLAYGLVCLSLGCNGGGEDIPGGIADPVEGALGGICRKQTPGCNAGLTCDLDGVCVLDCNSEAGACFPPFLCEKDDENLSYVCRDPEPTPGCRGTPEGQNVPFVLDASNIPIHWGSLPDGCIPVSYDSTVVDVVDRIRSAHAAWGSVPCSRLCFEEPALNERKPDVLRRERRVHWTTGVDGNVQILPTLVFGQDSGRLISVELALPADQAARIQLQPQVYLYGVGSASGLSPVSGAADSVMEPSQPVGGGSRTELGADDVAALCAMYGSPGYCDD